MTHLADKRPKCFVEVRGNAHLDRQLKSPRAAGITQIAVVTVYKRELLVDQGLLEFHNTRLAETFRLTPEQPLAEIGKRPTSVDEVQGQYMGLLRFTPEGWAEVTRVRAGLTSDQRDKMHMTGTLQEVIVAGRVAIAAVPYTDEWGEVDSPDDLDAYQ